MRKIAIAAVLLAGWAGPVSADGFSLLNVGIDYLNQQRYADAVTWLDKAIAAGDLNADQKHVAYLDRGQALVELNRPQEATADFTAALAIYPNDASAQVERGLAYIAASQPEKALEDMAALQTSASKTPWVAFYVGLMAWQLGRYQTASEAFSGLADKGYTDGWLWLQLANMKQNKAGTKYAGVRDPDGSMYISGIPYRWPGPLMSFYAGTKNEADVLKAMEDYYASKTTECESDFYLGEWRLVHGDMDGAKALLQKALTACPAGYVERRMARFELKKP